MRSSQTETRSKAKPLLSTILLCVSLVGASTVLAQIHVPTPAPILKPQTSDAVIKGTTPKQRQLLEQLKKAPRIDARLMRADCSSPTDSDPLIAGRFTRQNGGEPLGPVQAYAVYSGHTVRVNVRETTGTNTVDFEIRDLTLMGNMPTELPTAYNVSMRLPSGATPNKRVPIRFRWSPLVTLAGAPGDLQLRTLSTGEIVVRLPAIRVRQVNKLVAHLSRSGRSDSLQTEDFSVVGPSPAYERAYTYSEVLEAHFRSVPAAWRDSAPDTWDGVVTITGSADPTECTSGHRPENRLYINFAAAVPPPTDSGRYYRIHCACNHYADSLLTEREYADAQLKVCNAGGLGLDFRCAQAAGDLDGRFPPGPWMCTLNGSQPHPDTASCNPIPENYGFEELQRVEPR